MDRIKLTWGLLVMLALTGVAGGWWYWRQDSDEERIRWAMAEGRAAIEAEDLDRVMACVSTDYRDERGWTSLIVKRLLRDAFAQFDDFRVEMSAPRIEILDRDVPKAEVSFDLRLSVRLAGQKGLLVGSLNEPAHVQFTLTQESRRWLVTDVKGVRPGADRKSVV